MRYDKQLYRHEPHNEIYGDCHRTAMACVLDLPPHHVPHFYQQWVRDGGDGVTTRAAKWLAKNFGLYEVDVPYMGDIGVQELLKSLGEWNPGVRYLMGGRSPRGTDHTVVCLGNKIEHDPAQQGGGLVGPLSNGLYIVTYYVPMHLHPTPPSFLLEAT